MVTPREAVVAAFDHFASRRRISRQMVVMFLDSAHPELAISGQALDRLLATERRARAWTQQVEQLRTMRPSALKRLSRMVDRVLEEGPGGPQGKQHPWACAMYPHIVAELDRRSAVRDAIDPDRQRRERDELLRLADWALRELREGQRRPQRTPRLPQAGTPAGLCSPQPAPAQRELFSDDVAERPGAAGLVARLHRLKAERGANGEGVVYGSR